MVKHKHLKRMAFLAALCVVELGLNVTTNVQSQGLLIEQTISPKTASQLPSSQDRTMTAYRDWRVLCKTTGLKGSSAGFLKTCIIRNKINPVISLKDGGIIFSLYGQLIKLSKKKASKPVLIVNTPMGLLLPQGLAMKIDNNPVFKLAIRSCHLRRAEGYCLAPFELTRRLRKKFQVGKQVVISGRLLTGQKVSQKISLLGFSKALKHLNKHNRKSNLH